MDEDIEAEFPIWNIWRKKGISIQELRWKWTYEDIQKANAILEMEDCYEAGIQGVIEKDSETR